MASIRTRTMVRVVIASSVLMAAATPARARAGLVVANPLWYV
jgi:hypothetical protein